MRCKSKSILPIGLLAALLASGAPALAALEFGVASQQVSSSPIPPNDRESASMLFSVDGGSFSGSAKAFAHASDLDRPDFEESETSQGFTVWSIVLSITGTSTTPTFLQASASLNGSLAWNNLPGRFADRASSSVDALYAVNGTTVLSHLQTEEAIGPAKDNVFEGVSVSGSKSFGEVASGDTVTITGRLRSNAFARSLGGLDTGESIATSDFGRTFDFSVALVPIPEPQTYLLMTSGLALLLVVARYRRR